MLRVRSRIAETVRVRRCNVPANPPGAFLGLGRAARPYKIALLGRESRDPRGFVAASRYNYGREAKSAWKSARGEKKCIGGKREGLN
ncbi:hypothetical protein Ddc_13801 [Ditylenchus destructor]|nr:hypothetical protein Ddc_13801 [Ditylenchus destructor]